MFSPHVEKAYNLTGFFYKCENLKTLDLSEWDVKYVKRFENTFYGCSSLTTLNISNWNTSSATTMESMFEKCSSLTELERNVLDNTDNREILKKDDGLKDLIEDYEDMDEDGKDKVANIIANEGLTDKNDLIDKLDDCIESDKIETAIENINEAEVNEEIKMLQLKML